MNRNIQANAIALYTKYQFWMGKSGEFAPKQLVVFSSIICNVEISK
ncbi:MAG TPA: hypothetical protein V6D12_22915 [Candidatus Obscuribacterales bacterium]